MDNNTSKLVTIITPNYNSGKYIEDTYSSIIQQTYENWEWLIIDDGSTDKSLQVIKTLASVDPRIKLLYRTKLPKGASACRNVGINNSKGDYILFLDADDILAKSCLENRILLMEQEPELNVGVFKMGMFHEIVGDSDIILNRFPTNDNDYLGMFLSYELPWPITSPFWKLEFLKKNKIQFSENYQRLQDPEFHVKILLCNNPQFKVFNDSKPDCYYRQPNRRVERTNINSLTKTIDSIKLFYSEMNSLLTQLRPNYTHYLDNFSINIFHSLLFYTKLPKMSPVMALYREMDLVRKVNKISQFQIRLFALLNVLGLTFIKGAGVSLLWNLTNRKLS